MEHDGSDPPQGDPGEPLHRAESARWTSWRVEPALLDQAQVGIIVTDVSGTIRECNRYAEHLYGQSREDLIGADAAAVAGELVSRDLAMEIATTLLGGETWEGDFRIRRDDRSLIDVHAVESGILDDDGHCPLPVLRDRIHCVLRSLLARDTQQASEVARRQWSDGTTARTSRRAA